jgi:hypothetical protein
MVALRPVKPVARAATATSPVAASSYDLEKVLSLRQISSRPANSRRSRKVDRSD